MRAGKLQRQHWRDIKSTERQVTLLVCVAGKLDCPMALSTGAEVADASRYRQTANRRQTDVGHLMLTRRHIRKHQ